jgi:uncharacterized protein
MSLTPPSAGWFTDPLGGVPAADWDKLAAGRFYSSALWLRLCAVAPGGASGAVHVGLPGGGLAAVPIAAVTSEPNLNLRWHDQLTRRKLPSPPAAGILVGQRRGYLAHLLVAPGADRAEAVGRLLAAVRGVRAPGMGTGGAPPCVAMYLTTADVIALREAGVWTMPVALKTDAWIEIPPGGWDAWMESIGSQHRVQRIRSEVRRFQRVGYQVRHLTLLECYRDAARLLARTQGRYGQPVDVDMLSQVFRDQGELAGPRAEVLLCVSDGQPPVGFCLFYRWGDTVYLRAAGFDYDELNSAAEYFNLVYYIPGRFPGVRWLHAGTGTAEGKALRGATLHPLWLLDLSVDSVLQGRDDDVLGHNRAFVEELRKSSPAVAAALADEEWDLFC